MWMNGLPHKWVERRKKETSSSLTSLENDGAYRYNCSHRWFHIGQLYSNMKQKLDHLEKAIANFEESPFPNQHLVDIVADLSTSIQFDGEDLLIFLEGYEDSPSCYGFIAGKPPYNYFYDYARKGNADGLIFRSKRTIIDCRKFLDGIDSWLKRGAHFQIGYLPNFENLDIYGNTTDQVQKGINLIVSGFHVTGLFALVRCIEYTIKQVYKAITDHNNISELSFANIIDKFSEQPNDGSKPLFDGMAQDTLNTLKNLRNTIAHWDTGKSVDGEFFSSIAKDNARQALSVLKYLDNKVGDLKNCKQKQKRSDLTK